TLVGVPRGGLTYRTARSLIRTGEALRGFAEHVSAGSAMPELSDSEVESLLAGREDWKSEPTPAFRLYLRQLQALPRIAAFVGTRPLSRLERKAQTASLYERAVKAGHPNPRAVVAQVQKRTVLAVSADLHAA